nr:uncharacterized protein LOC104121354 [Nicotiana tomentosiformis]
MGRGRPRKSTSKEQQDEIIQMEGINTRTKHNTTPKGIVIGTKEVMPKAMAGMMVKSSTNRGKGKIDETTEVWPALPARTPVNSENLPENTTQEKIQIQRNSETIISTKSDAQQKLQLENGIQGKTGGHGWANLFASNKLTARGESNETYSGGKRNQDKNFRISTNVTKLVSENAIIVIATRGCCMCYVVKNLLLGLGVNPTIFEVNSEDEEAVMKELSRIVGGDEQNDGGRWQFPVVFVGGRLFGGIERVMSTHISGELVPILKEAGALWL